MLPLRERSGLQRHSLGAPAKEVFNPNDTKVHAGHGSQLQRRSVFSAIAASEPHIECARHVVRTITTVKRSSAKIIGTYRAVLETSPCLQGNISFFSQIPESSCNAN